MKALVLEVLKREKINVEDDLRRIERHCGRLASFEMDMEYGESGKTAQEILDAARRKQEDMARAIRWVERRAKEQVW